MRLTIFAAMFAFLLWGSPAIAGPGIDTDEDGIPDSQDNCRLDKNPLQTDTDGDFCGNLCDADYDQNGLVAFADFTQFSFAFGKSTDLEKDHTEPNTGPVGFSDFTFFSFAFNSGPPGPSGTSPGTTACPN